MSQSNELELLSATIRANSLLTSTDRHRIADLMDAMGKIHGMLDGQVWDPDTPMEIAHVLDMAGIGVREPEDEPQ